jgi:hypothetical protein
VVPGTSGPRAHGRRDPHQRKLDWHDVRRAASHPSRDERLPRRRAPPTCRRSDVVALLRVTEANALTYRDPGATDKAAMTLYAMPRSVRRVTGLPPTFGEGIHGDRRDCRLRSRHQRSPPGDERCQERGPPLRPSIPFAAPRLQPARTSRAPVHGPTGPLEAARTSLRPTGTFPPAPWTAMGRDAPPADPRAPPEGQSLEASIRIAFRHPKRSRPERELARASS